MGDLVRAFERFLGRDLVFILAGAIILICSGRVLWAQGHLHDVDLMHLSEISWIWIGLGIGFAYVTGYVVQELFSLPGFTSTAIEGEPCCSVKWLFRNYQRREWKERTFNSSGSESRDGELLAQIRLQRSSEKSLEAHVERMTYLMQVGTALGSASLFGCGLLIAWWFGFFECLGFFPNRSTRFDIVAGVALLAAGLILLAIGAVKRAQLREHVFVADQTLDRAPRKM